LSETHPKYCLAPGTILGNHYQIIKLIGQGGMGSVYLGFDTRLELQVAIKVISPEFSRTMDEGQLESVLKRFEAEAKTAAKIDHPNIIRIFGFNRENIELEGRRHEIDYLIMELVSGRTLRNTMDVSGFEYEEEIKNWITKYMLPILDGLQKVHEGGIIHRDIKPENFLMKDDVPKLADFGLSMGFSLPPVTGAVADIFGTVTYMAPEQFYNFSMAREPADIYSIGKILFEAVEGKISGKAKPFQQVSLSKRETPFLEALNRIVMEATLINPMQRTQSARELKEKLMQLLYCDSGLSREASRKRVPSWIYRTILPIVIATALIVGLLTIQWMQKAPSAPAPAAESHNLHPSKLGSVRPLPYTDSPLASSRSGDKSVLKLVPPAEIELADENVLGSKKIMIEAFYLSEAPITNQQYIGFLNSNMDRVKVVDTDVLLDGRLALKISEKIRNYKPITFDGQNFIIKEPMHSACAVLLVTGYGAEAYAKYFNLRLPSPQEWLYVTIAGIRQNPESLQLPIPVINYEPDSYGLRGINQIAEWVKTLSGDFIILGPASSHMVEGSLVLEKDEFKYFTDTSFRVARNVEK
jgi:serine/threonine-protein kinase